MTAFAAPMPRAVGMPAVSAPRVNWREPNTWTVALVLTTSVLVLARHPLARALGTEVDSSDVVVATAPPAPAPAATAATAPAAVPAAVPTHAPRDPFQVLDHPATKPVAYAAPAPAAPPAAVAAPAPAASACTGTLHRVAPGESLWSIAASSSGKTQERQLVLAWHRIYTANRQVVGPNPSLLPVGVQLCLGGH